MLTTLASTDRIEAILRNQHAKLIIQHSTEDFDSWLPSPGFLD